MRKGKRGRRVFAAEQVVAVCSGAKKHAASSVSRVSSLQ